jgi:hypothetical protein
VTDELAAAPVLSSAAVVAAVVAVAELEWVLAAFCPCRKFKKVKSSSSVNSNAAF